MTQATALEKTSQPAAPLALAEKPNSLAKMDMRELKQLAEIMVASGAFEDIKDVAKAQVKIMAGAELGFSPIVSMTGIHFFKGKVSIGSNLIASLIKESPKYDYEVLEHTSDACAVQFYRLSGGGVNARTPLGPPVRYTIAEAKSAGLTTKDTWSKYPADLLFAAVIRQGARRHCADVLRGTTSETGDEVTFESISSRQIASVAETVEHNGDVVDLATGEVVEENSPAPQPSTEHKPAESSQAPTGDAAAAVGTLFAGTVETSEDEIREWIRALARTKFGTDKDAYKEFLNGRNPTTMDRDSLIKLHGDLAAL